MIVSFIASDSPHIHDLENFTRDRTVIFDRDAFALAGGRAFKDRETIVVTTDLNYHAPGVTVMRSLTEALRFAALEQGKHFEEKQEETEVFIIGKEFAKEATARAQKFY